MAAGDNTSRGLDWTSVEDLFHRALELPAPQRQAWAATHCADNAIREAVLRMLRAHDECGSFLAVSPMANLRADGPIEDGNIGRQFGAYRVVEPIARGGMGIVYRAVRVDREYDKLVALKMIRCDLATRDTRRYFERERQLLAQLDHPNIASLLDGGTSPEGMPYLVMELVRGVTIDQYCNAHRLNVAQRLRLFLIVCRAVAHAHRNLVVHRDLKPSNILITDEGDPKLLDFGLSKLVEAEPVGGDEQTTMVAAWTPQYASPEQINGQAISTSTDVYSLGVILYELLTGHRPYAMDSRSPLSTARAVCETIPRPMSTVVARSRADGAPTQTAAAGSDETIAGQRSVSPAQLRRQLRGDLESIVQKALEKEPSRRYATVELFAQDIERHLAGLPVSVRDGRTGYRVSKFVRRHRWIVGASCIAAISLVAGTVIATTSLIREGIARRQADVEAARAEQVNRFLTDMLLSVDPRRNGRDVRVIEMLQWAAQRLRESPRLSDEVAGSLEATVGVAYRTLGLYDDALPHLVTALDLSTRSLGRTHPHTLQVMNHLALLYWAMGDADQAHALLEQVIAALAATDHADEEFELSIRNNAAGLAWTMGRLGEAEAMFRAVLARQRELLGDEHADTLRSMSNLMLVLRDSSRLEEAESLIRAVCDARGRTLPADHPDLVDAQINLAAVLFSRDDFEGARALTEKALATHRKTLGPTHPSTAAALHNLGNIYSRLRRFDDAEAALVEAIEIRHAVLGPTHLDTLWSEYSLAGVDLERDRLPRARERIESLLETVKNAAIRPQWEIAVFCARYAEVLARQGDPVQAERVLQESLVELRDRLGADHPQTRKVQDQLAGLSKAPAVDGR